MAWIERRAVWLAIGLALLHAGLALAYAAATPYLTPGRSNGLDLPDIGAPDEAAHVHNVATIYEGRGLPVLKPKEAMSPPAYEAHQPPQYYLVAAYWCKALGVNPSNRTSGLAVRSLNAVFGVATILGVFFFALWTVGRPLVAISAAAIAASLPMLAALDGAASNDPLLFAYVTWTLALLARWRDNLCMQRAGGVAMLIGLAVLTKTTGLLLAPVFLAAVWRTSEKGRLASALVGLFAMAIIVAPWIGRNLALYGDPLGMSAFYATFTRDVFPAEVFSGLRPLAHWLYVLSAGTALSFVGIFGYMDIHLSYALYLPILALVGLGLGAAARRSNDLALRLPIGGFVLLLIASFVAYNLWQVQPQARYLFPAIGPIALWIALGLERLARGRTLLLNGLLVGLLAVANVSVLNRLPGEFKLRVEAAAAQAK